MEDDEDLELIECPNCKELDDGDLFSCKMCERVVCQNCTAGGVCEHCEAKHLGIVTVHFR